MDKKRLLSSVFNTITKATILYSLSIPINAFAQWGSLSPMNEGRFDITALQYKDNIYVFNGFTTGIDIVPSIEKFNADTFDWSMFATTSVASGSAVTHNGLIRDGNTAWVIGGRIGDHPGAVSDLVWKYNLDTGTVSQGPTMPVPVGGGGAALVDNKIHFIGGFDKNASCDVSNHFVYDLSNPNDGWQDITAVAPVPVPRNHFATTVLNGEIYMLGGQFGHGGCADYTLNGVDTNLVHAYNPKTQVWTKKANLPNQQSHMEAGTFAYGGAIYIAGGESEQDEMYRYNPENNSWATLSMPAARHGPTSRVVGNNMIVAGGGGGNSGSTPLADTFFTDMRSLLLPSASGLAHSLKSANATAFNNANSAKLAVDEDMSTRWTSGQGQESGQWFQLDLGSMQLVGNVVFNSSQSQSLGQEPASYTLQTSEDGTNFVAVATGSGSSDGLTEINFNSRSARYVRITQTGSSPNQWWSINEVKVSEGDVEALSRNNWSLSASNNTNETGSAIDDDSTTRWTTKALQSPTQWLQIDLSQQKTFNKIELDSEASAFDYPRFYTIKVSNDANNWKTVASGAGSGSDTAISFSQQNARYVRIEQSGSNSVSWWSVHEVNLYAGSANTVVTDVPPEGKADNYNATAGVTKTLDPLANDIGNNLTLNAPSAWSLKGGTVELSNNQLIYTANASYTGEDKIWYNFTDSQNRSSWSVITIAVSGGVVDVSPVSNPDNVSATAGVSVVINPLANDTGNGLLLNAPNDWSWKGGTVKLSNNQLTYTANSSFTGEDKIWYSIKDLQGRSSWSVITIAVTGGAAADFFPIANPDNFTTSINTAKTIDILANDSTSGGIAIDTLYAYSAKGGQTSRSGNNVLYKPKTGFTGEDNFWYVMIDAQGRKNSAQVKILVTQ